MKNLVVIVIMSSIFGTMAAQNVSNIRVQQSDEQLIVMYDLDTMADIEAHVSFDGGVTYIGPLQHVFGAVGKDVSPGKDKVLLWNVLRELGAVDNPNTVMKIVATTEPATAPPIEMVFVQGGTFTMGSPRNGNKRKVTLDSYHIGKYPVTQAQWESVMGSNSNPSHFKGANLPVERVSWHDVQEFIRKLNALTGMNYRLPSEAEWEYAARGGKRSKGYIYSGSNNIDDVGWYWRNSNSTQPVGTKVPNGLEIYDMSGNVWEWCSGMQGSYHVIRGGSWNDDIEFCRVTSRENRNYSGSRGDLIGFRLALCSE